MRRLPAVVLAIALAAACLPRAGVAQGQGPMPLTSYPRPAGDNGRGIHWAPTLFGQPTQMVDRFVAEAEAMDVTWVKLLQGDAPKLEHAYLIAELRERGMMPILRVFKPENEPYEHLDALVRLGVAAGVSYFELYNEPNLSGESGGWPSGESISVSRVVDLWIPAAEAVRAAGGLPGLPALAPGGDYDDNLFLRQFLQDLKGRGRVDLLYGAWLPLHNYFLNHPLDYPYDAVNLQSVALTATEIAARGLTADEVSRINEARRNSRLPRSQGGYYVGDTIYADSNGFLKFQAYAGILEDEVGFLIPIITTEGGAIIGSAEDPRYPPVSEADLVETTLGAYRYIEENRPAYYFAFAPWLMANRAGNSLSAAWERAAWYKEDGSTLAVVPALKASDGRPLATAAATPTPVAAPTATVTPPASAMATAAAVESLSLRTQSMTLWVQAPAASPTAVTPAQSTYPRPAEPTADGASEQSRQVNAVVIGGGDLEAWFLPDYGGRLVRLVDRRTGQDVLALPARLAPGGAARLEGGVAWLYPSPSLPLVDDVAWQVDAAGSESALRMTLAEPRSRTQLTLDASIAADGSLTVSLTAANPNTGSRLVSLGLSDPSALFVGAASGVSAGAALGDALLPPGGSYTWTLTRAGSGTAADTAQPSATPAATAQPGGTPVAMATPIPFGTPQSQPNAAPTRAATAAAPTATHAAQAGAAEWDERLTDMGVTVTSGSGARWRLIAATYEDETESGGNHHIFLDLVDAGGDPCADGGDQPWVTWSDGTQTLADKDTGTDGFASEFPMYGPLGAYSVGIGSSSDVVVGLGLPAKHHVNYHLTFQRQS